MLVSSDLIDGLNEFSLLLEIGKSDCEDSLALPSQGIRGPWKRADAGLFLKRYGWIGLTAERRSVPKDGPGVRI